MTCQSCKSICHSECSKNFFSFNHATNQWLCKICHIDKANRYNPFDNLNTKKKYDQFSIEDVDDIKTISKVLNESKSYNHNSLKSTLKNLNTNNNISILFNNIDGNSSNFDSFVAEINQYNADFSVIGIAETNVNEENKNLYQITGYSAEYNSKIRGKLKGSGLGIYVHEKYQFNKVEKLCRCSEDIESLFIEITNTEVAQFVGVIYRPPNGSKPIFCQELELLVKELPNKNVAIMGDFNINLLTNSSSEFENTIYASNLIPTIAIATHEKPGCLPTLIDNILTNSTDNLIVSGVLESRVSHHLPIFCVLDCPATTVTHKLAGSPKYDYNSTNTESFLQELELKLYNSKFDYESENSFNDFAKMLNDCIDTNFLVDEGSVPKSKRNRLLNPWISNGIINSIQQKCLYYKKWKKSCNPKLKQGDESLYSTYKNFRLKLRKIIKVAKKSYYSKKFDNVKGNLKKTWELINELRGKKKSNIKASFIIDGKLIEDQREIANEFNMFFASIARKVNAKVYSSTLKSQESNQNFMRHLRGSGSFQSSMFMTPCTEDELVSIISNLENGKASDISIPLLKKCSKFIIGHLSRFYQSFLEHGIFPEILKRGSITPIYKKADPRFLDNYRPVSTLPIFGKILEKILYERLYSYFSSKGIIYENQFGFRKHHSTSHAVNYSINHIIKELESKKHIIGIFIDLSKAFDTISHLKLLQKLQFYGVRGKSLDIFASYLSDRKQKANFKGTHSGDLAVEYGVPQGSVLGPLLFLIYINDIINSSDQGEFVMFADDTNIFISCETEKAAYECANNVLKNIQEYMLDNMLHINATKSCFMYFKPNICNDERLTSARTREYSSKYSITLCGQKLKCVKAVKFLGVIIDEDLSWDAHIDHLANTLNSSIVIIKRIRKFIPCGEYRKLYDALFASHLTYCISCWGGVANYKLSRLFSIQKRCIRLLFGKEFSYDHPEFYQTCARVRSIDIHRAPKNFELEHTKPLFNSEKILNLENLYKMHTFMEVFKILKFSAPISLNNLFEMSDRVEKFILKVPLIKSLRQRKNFISSASIIWNDIVSKVLSKSEPISSGIVVSGTSKNSDLTISIPVMKARLKSHLLCFQQAGDPTHW